MKATPPSLSNSKLSTQLHLGQEAVSGEAFMELQGSVVQFGCGRYRARPSKGDIEKTALPETKQGAPSMSKSMENKTAAIYLRRSTEDDGMSVGRSVQHCGV